MAATPPDEIPNDRLTVAKIPREDATWSEIVRFAHTFNTYKQLGSFERCAEIANSKRTETLTDLRTCLFFEQRRWNHFGAQPDADAMIYIRELLTMIRAKASLI
jgi:hypothetical protein